MHSILGKLHSMVSDNRAQASAPLSAKWIRETLGLRKALGNNTGRPNVVLSVSPNYFHLKMH